MHAKDLLPWNWHWPRGSVPVRTSEQQHPITSLQDQINSAFDRFYRALEGDPEALFAPGFARGGFLPALDVVDDDKEIRVTLELPGMDSKDFDIHLEDDVLRIRGEKYSEESEKGRAAQWSECSYGSFERMIPLHCEIDRDGVEATFRKSVLTVRLPKSKAAIERRRHVPIRSE